MDKELEECIANLVCIPNESGIDCLTSLVQLLPRFLKERDDMRQKIENAIGCLVCAGISDPHEVCENTLSILLYTLEDKLGELNES